MSHVTQQNVATLLEGMSVQDVCKTWYGNTNRGALGATVRMLKRYGYVVVLDGGVRRIQRAKTMKLTLDTPEPTPQALSELVNNIVQHAQGLLNEVERLQTTIENMMKDMESMRNTLNSVSTAPIRTRPLVERALAVYGD